MSGRWSVLGPVASCLFATAASAQSGGAKPEVRRLFREDAPLAITIAADFKAVSAHRDTINRILHPATLTFPGDSGPIVLPIELSTRGHFRLLSSVCSFPPLKVYFPKDK